MSAPNRETARDALYTLINSGMASLQQTINGDPSNTLQGQSPVAVIRSGGSQRLPMLRNTDQTDNNFRFTVSIWVNEDTANLDDVLDGLDQELALLIENTSNRSTANWQFLRFDDSMSTVLSVSLSGHDYRVEVYDIIIRVWG